MDPVDSGNRSAAPSGARPSLFANGQSAPAGTSKQPEAISILSSLDKNGGKKPLSSSTGLPTWLTIAVGSLLGITIGAAIVMSLTRDTGIGRRTPPSPMIVARTAAPETAPEPPAAVAPAPATPTPIAEVNAAATIENAPPAAAAPATGALAGPQPAASDAAKKLAAATPEAPTPVAAETISTTKASAAPVPSAPTPTTAKASSVERPETRAERASAAKKAKTKDGKPETETATAAPSDRDASLLAALVAYGEGRPAADINARAAPMTNKSANTKSANGTTTLAQAGQFDPKRDVVTREPTVSTTELVRRCKTLGFFEGLLCRMRVCSNLWGKDAACPQSSAPSEPGTQ
jgi:hypothetical protein